MSELELAIKITTIQIYWCNVPFGLSDVVAEVAGLHIEATVTIVEAAIV
jgi:hypothetical protein